VHTADEDRYRDEYLYAVERLGRAGYVHYEVSNFARPGRESRHNRVYWDGGAYLGLGNGAHSFAPPLRRWNLRDWADYAVAAAVGRSPSAGEEFLSEEAHRLERVWLALRTDRGLPWTDLTAAGRALAERWRAAGLAVPAGTGVPLRLTAEGWLVLDRLAVDMDEALGGAAAAISTV
jgi:oxygen-independent coproporphyrinogen-3 oxidase